MPQIPVNAQRILDQWSLPIMILDHELRFTYANDAYLRATKCDWSDLEGQYVFDVFPDERDRVASVKEKFLAALAGETTHLDAQPFNLEDESGEVHLHYWRAVQEPCRNAEGQITHMLQYAEDITSQIKLMEQKNTLTDELNHRVKNILAIVEATARITGRRATSITQFVSDFTARIQAMGRAHERLFSNAWTGTDVKDVLVDALQVFSDDQHRQISMDGPDCYLSMAFSKDLSMIVHELATNAMKYGALSKLGGHITINWAKEPEHFVINWQENGMKDLTAPNHTGFGSKLLNMMPKVKAEREFLPEGVSVRIIADADFALTGK